MLKEIFEIVENLKYLLDVKLDNTERMYFQLNDIHSKLTPGLILGVNLREQLLNYLLDLEIEKIESNLLTLTEGRTCILYDLFDNELVSYFITVMKTINFSRKDNFMLLKYSNSIFYTGWHKLAKLHRGKVYDLNSFKIVAYPFDKFFNINEVEETSYDIVYSLLKDKSVKVTATDKKDGSSIIMTNVNGVKLVHTGGGFDNIQTELALEMLKKQYSYFYEHIPEGYTFIFELVHPKNRIILDYGKTEKLYLLAVRDLSNLKLLSYTNLELLAHNYYLDITEVEYLSVEDMLELSQKRRGDGKLEKEGWVVRIETDTVDMLLKIKLADYFDMSRLYSRMNIRNVYNLYYEETLDDLLSTLDESSKSIVNIVMKEIFDIFDIIQTDVYLKLSEISNDYGITPLNFSDKSNGRKIGELISSLKGNPLMSYVVSVLKGIEIDFKFEPNKFEKLVDYVNITHSKDYDVLKIYELFNVN